MPLWMLGQPPPPEYTRDEDGVPRPPGRSMPEGGPGLLLLREPDGGGIPEGGPGLLLLREPDDGGMPGGGPGLLLLHEPDGGGMPEGGPGLLLLREPDGGGMPGGGPGLLLLREPDGVPRCGPGALSLCSLCSLPPLPPLSLRVGVDDASIGVGSFQGLMMVLGTDVAGTRPTEAGGWGGSVGSCAICAEMSKNGGKELGDWPMLTS